MTIIEVGCFLRAEFRAEFWRKSWRISLPSAWLKKKWPKYLKNAPPKSGIIDVDSSFFGTYSITFPVGIMSEKQTGQWDKYLKKSSRISKEFKKPTGFSDRKIKADGFRLSSWIYNFTILSFNFWKFRFVVSELVVGSGEQILLEVRRYLIECLSVFFCRKSNHLRKNYFWDPLISTRLVFIAVKSQARLLSSKRHLVRPFLQLSVRFSQGF